MAIQSLQDVFPIARSIAEDELGHVLSRFDTYWQAGACAHCTRPGCNMGLTVLDDDPDYLWSIVGSAATFRCAAPGT